MLDCSRVNFPGLVGVVVLFTAVCPRKSNIHNYSFVKSLNKSNEVHDNKNPENTDRIY